jgi:flagellar hook-associated protein 2
MASPIAATGLGSNLDVTGLVDKMMTIEQQPVTELQSKQAAVQVKLTSYGTFRGSLSTFQSSVQALADNSVYSVSKGALANADIGSVSTNATAAAGSYSVEVTNLAKSQKLASGPFKAATDPVGTGTLTFEFGTAAPDVNDATKTTWTVNPNKTVGVVKIDPANNTLSGVRDAINKANIGVNATIVNDGKGYRLVVSSKETGAANGLKISVAEDGQTPTNTDGTGLSALAYDPTLTAFDVNNAGTTGGKNMTQLIAAEDAQLKVDGLDISSSTNTVSGVIDGVTLTLAKTNKDAPTQLTVTQDTSGVGKSVSAFVQAWNDLNKTIGDLTKYNADTKQASPLQGDPAVREIASDLRDNMTRIQSGAVGSFKALPQIGITFDRNGNLQVDQKKFDAAMQTDPGSVQGLFASIGKTDDSLTQFVGSGTSTKAGAYGVNITQLATQGSVTGNVKSADLNLSITDSNDTLNVTVNSTTVAVKLTQKTYASAAELMSEVASKINSNSSLVSAKASVELKADATTDFLTLNSKMYGSGSKIAITGNGADNLFGQNPTSSAGLDVAGTIGGMAATGAGQRLTGTGAASGLQLDVLGGATGDRGLARFGVGIGGQLNQMIDRLLGAKGLLASKTDTLTKQDKALQDNVDKLNERLETVRARYTAQFNSLDEQLSTMQSTSAYLAQQLAAIKTG